ncbi:SLATT domain-containing protein [Streptomyces gibsoniae]|uniref:SLATT domain-containing protein n=1 Tax=Streptomyces gibsoniae TaxID=3075529 RepID=A0ABU2TRY0_9ACTN|nr:SLATT domain-containing protein [Streptomyces sp. DSM 41699]MDT0463676.1 SLATT domain-containing protein [Streptomyces sp. DSM 41699]
MRRQANAEEDWASQADPLLALAQKDLGFYGRQRDRARLQHYVTEIGALLATSSTVVAAGLHAPAWLTALIAGSAVFFTGMRQLFNPAPRWVLASQSRETLRRSVDRYLLLPPSERDTTARAALHAAIEEVGTNELREWSEAQHQRTAPPLPTQQT